MTFFYFHLISQKASVLSKRIMFLANTLFQSCFRYSIHSFFFCKSLLFSFFSYLSLGYLSHLLNSMLNTVGLYHLFQAGQESLLLFVPLLYLSLLLFKYLSIILGNVRENRGRYNSTKEEQKKISVYILLTQVLSQNSLDKLNRTLKTQS